MQHDVRRISDQYDLWVDLTVLTDEEVGLRQFATVKANLTEYDSSTVAFSGGATPAFFIAETADETVLTIAGASSATMFANLFQGSLYPGLQLGNAHVNGGLVPPAAEIIRALKFPKGLNTPLLTIVGHSYGGALAEVVAAWISQVNRQQPIQVLTGGTPRAGDQGLSAVLNALPNVRLMTAADPIPRFPPHFTEAPFATCQLPYLIAYNWSFFQQPGGGYILAPDGSETAAVLPPMAGPITDLNLLTWLTGTNGAASKAHSYRTYLQYLNAGAGALMAPPLPLQEAGLKDELSPIPTPEQIRMGPVVGPVEFLKAQEKAMSVYVPPDYRMKVVKVGKTYQVSWGPFTVAQGQTRSNAKTYAKYGNKFCRIMQTVAVVNHTDLGNALQWYLTAASSTTTGFQPVLTVV